MLVAGSDGERLGVVAECQGDRFRLSAPTGDGLWLAMTAVGSICGQHMRLVCGRTGLERHRVDPQP
jgi:hypothetical protein